MAGTRTSIAEQLANAAVGTEVEPPRQTVRPQSSVPSPQSSAETAESSQVPESRQGDEKTNSLPGAAPGLPPVTLFSPPKSSNPAERLTYCTGAIQEADRRTELATEQITQQYLLWVGEPYRIVRDEELYRVAGYSSFDDWGRALNGRSGDYMNKIIRVAPVVRALSHITRRQLKEQPLRPLIAVQRERGDEAVRRCWRKAEASGDLTERGLRAAAVACGYAIAPEPQPLRPAKTPAALQPSDILRLTKLQQLAGTDPQRALALCRQVQNDLARLEQDLLNRPAPDADGEPRYAE
uniref:Uncharacterized protein n=1 Tax=Streptomyces rochei TaxID=1928 RepID=A0A068Q7T3_STRRO|nr:hypothetical protein [Streptomyces rochei]